MKFLKKALAIIVLSLMAFSLVGCDNHPDNGKNKDSEKNSASDAPDTPWNPNDPFDTPITEF